MATAALPGDLRTVARAWSRAGRPAVVVEVTEARGSVPREAGTRMLVAGDPVVGTIGGGHLELEAITRARSAVGSSAITRWDVALGPTLGQCCGGALSLTFQPLTSELAATWPAEPALFNLMLYGAGHVGRAIVQALAPLPCRVVWIDERDSEFPLDASPAQVERRCVEPVEAEVAQAASGDFHLVLTHSHDLDLRITEAVLKRADFGFLGLIGSATKRARFLHRFEMKGVPADVLARLVCPIGIAGITGKAPPLIAAAVVAQLLQVAEHRRSASAVTH